MKYLIALIAIAAGCFLVIKTEWLIASFGTSSWAEQHMGTSGGTRLLYKLIGIIIIVLAFMGVTGMLGDILLSFFGPLFGGSR
jgi:hypothetical protein